jgi:mono/diheme cytochrome c family protein
MTMHEAGMTTHAHVSTTRRFGAVALLGGLTLSLALAVTVAAAPVQAGDTPAKPAAAAKVDAAELYQAKCQVCHMADGNSQIMPNMSFADGVWKHGATLKAVQTTISNGVPGTAMIAWKEQLSPAEIAALAKFVRKFDKKLK